MSKAASSPSISPDKQRLPPGWASDTLDNLVQFRSGSTPDKAKEEYWGGDLPWVTAKDLKRTTIGAAIDQLSALGASKAPQVGAGAILLLVRGMTLHNDIPLAITSRTVSFNQDVKALVPNKLAEPLFLLNYLQSIKGKLLKSVESAGHGTGRLNTKFLKSLRVPLPPIDEQRRIVATLSTWDETLERLSRQIERKKRLLESIRERLIHGAHRLGGRNSPWPMIALSEVTKQLTERNGARYGRDLVMGVTKAEGIVPMREHVVAEDISRYLVLPPLGFAYNPMRINIGSIAMSEHEHDVIVSPDYVVFACKEDRLHPPFLNHLRRTKAWADFMTIAGNGSVRVRIYYASLAEFEFHLPPLDEQRAIVEVLDDAEREIAALEAERAALAKQRDALATELLTGRLRVPQAEAAS